MRKLAKRILDRFGYKTDKKLIIIASDDWGSIRVKSKKSRERLIAQGIDMDANRFNRFDSLETNEDLERLFEVLLKYKDHKGNHPVITAVTNVANPDFEKIKENNFREYFFEPFTETLKRYPNREKVFNYYQEGIKNKIFVPQSHGREHLQVKWWMQLLQADHNFTRIGFENEFFFLDRKYLRDTNYPGLGAAFDLKNLEELTYQREIISSGLEIFEKLFGYPPCHFTPPAMYFNKRLEPTLQESGIKWLDLPKFQQMPTGNFKTRARLNYLGKRKKGGTKILTRNAVFEPNINENNDGVNQCLQDIENAFKNRQPTIISNHRAAFISGINEKNGFKGLKSLDKLLSTVLKRWPEVEFLTPNDL